MKKVIHNITLIILMITYTVILVLGYTSHLGTGAHVLITCTIFVLAWELLDNMEDYSLLYQLND